MMEKIYEYDEVPLPNFDGKYRHIDVPLVKYITARVRKTIEYHNLIDYMKKTMDINRCSFYKDYSMENGFIIELHHSPLTLFDIVEAVSNKHFKLNKESSEDGVGYLEPWIIEEEVNILHYEFLVGLVPLNPSAHKLVHSGKLKIHPRMVIGNWKRFMSEYEDYISDDVRGKIEEFYVLAKTNPDEISDLVKYTPVLINNIRFKSLGSVNIQSLIVDKLKQNFIESQKKG